MEPKIDQVVPPRTVPEFGFWEAEGYRLPDNFNSPDLEIEALFYCGDEEAT